MKRILEPKIIVGAALVLGLAVGACRSGDANDVPAFRHQDFYQQLQRDAESFIFAGGEWLEDFGDGAFYGLAFYTRQGAAGDEAAAARARGAALRNREILGEADLVAGDVNQIVMAALGLIEHIAASGDRTGLGELDELIDEIANLVSVFGHYIPPEMAPGYAMQTYGPVAVNGLVALVSLQRAALPGDERDAARIVFAEQLVEQLRQRHLVDGAYAMGGDRPGLFLYPNITMIIVHAKLYQLTGRPAHRDHALAAYGAIAPLRVEPGAGLVGPGRYRSPYSAEHIGARSDDYSTLSSQNYAMLALMLLYQITGEARFLREVDPILDFARDELAGRACAADLQLHRCEPSCGDGQACLRGGCHDDVCHSAVLHHWIDGRLATDADAESFCSGCNLQLLYVMWYRQHAALERYQPPSP